MQINTNSYQLRRGKLFLGKFSSLEIQKLLARSKLNSSDEILTDNGNWEALSIFIKKIPPLMPSATSVGGNTKPKPRPASSGAKTNKVSYLNLWLKTTLWIYGIGLLLGFLAAGTYGLGVSLAAGLLLAPIKGAFWAWIIWLFKK
jgi:hypothetical protein